MLAAGAFSAYTPCGKAEEAGGEQGSASSCMGDLSQFLAGLAESADWQDGQRFAGNATEDDVRAWARSVRDALSQQVATTDDMTPGTETYRGFSLDNVLHLTRRKATSTWDPAIYGLAVPDRPSTALHLNGIPLYFPSRSEMVLGMVRKAGRARACTDWRFQGPGKPVHLGRSSAPACRLSL